MAPGDDKNCLREKACYTEQDNLQRLTRAVGMVVLMMLTPIANGWQDTYIGGGVRAWLTKSSATYPALNSDMCCVCDAGLESSFC
jgi:hypothetical protein